MNNRARTAEEWITRKRTHSSMSEEDLQKAEGLDAKDVVGEGRQQWWSQARNDESFDEQGDNDLVRSFYHAGTLILPLSFR